MPTTPHRHTDNPSPPRKPNPVVLSLFLKPIIMLFILSFFLFLGIAAVSLLLILLAGSSLHLCRRNRSAFAAAAATLPVEDLQKYIPRFNYDARLESAKDCAVCLECFKEGELCRRLCDCNHIFHVSCVDSWLTKVLNCPICRAPINLNPFGSGSLMSEDDDFKLWWPVGV